MQSRQLTFFMPALSSMTVQTAAEVWFLRCAAPLLPRPPQPRTLAIKRSEDHVLCVFFGDGAWQWVPNSTGVRDFETYLEELSAASPGRSRALFAFSVQARVLVAQYSVLLVVYFCLLFCGPGWSEPVFRRRGSSLTAGGEGGAGAPQEPRGAAAAQQGEAQGRAASGGAGGEVQVQRMQGAEVFVPHC